MMMFEHFPCFDMGDFVLRELKIEDAPNFLTYMTHPEVASFIDDDSLPKNLIEAEREVTYWKNLFHYRHSIYWGIAQKSTDQLIGSCGYNVWSKSHHRGDISYDLARPFWGQGIMTCALGIIIHYGFQEMHMHRIQAMVSIQNASSIHLLEKLFFQNEGTLREYGRLHRLYHDSFIYARLNPVS